MFLILSNQTRDAVILTDILFVPSGYFGAVEVEADGEGCY